MGPTVSLMVSQSKEMSISFVALVHQRPRRDLVAKWSRIAGQRMEGQTIEEDAQCLPSTSSQTGFVELLLSPNMMAYPCDDASKEQQEYLRIHWVQGFGCKPVLL